jgi:hypothetical protein
MVGKFFNFKKVLLFVIGLLITTYVLAQPGDPGGDPDVPIDGGIGLLIAAGALYGTKKIREATRKK